MVERFCHEMLLYFSGIAPNNDPIVNDPDKDEHEYIDIEGHDEDDVPLIGDLNEILSNEMVLEK